MAQLKLTFVAVGLFALFTSVKAEPFHSPEKIADANAVFITFKNEACSVLKTM